MGLSGSGKSSLLRAVNGLNTVSRGELLVQDGDKTIDVAKCNAATLLDLRMNRISMVFQKFALMPWLSVVDNVAFGLEMKGVSKKLRYEKAMQQLEMVSLDQWSTKLPHELSGGMQQRVGLARAFAMDSDILLMDEPFSALDPLIRSQLQDELIELQNNLKKTIIFVSHDLDEALKIGSNIAIMESAKIVQHGTPEEIVLNPCNDYVKDFVAHTNPLNVLRGHSLMSNIDSLECKDNRVKINNSTYVGVTKDRKITDASYNGSDIMLSDWCEGEAVKDLPTKSIARVPADISMRDAVEICYHTGQSLLLCEGDRFVGILSDDNFYHALLGRHISTQTEASVIK
jgi:glycine betaine/proline transport system ATP-binding protein